jgi:ABC-type uncharacterized transport system auxiliary subunit
VSQQRAVALAALVVGLSGCASGLHSDAKPTQVYVLRAPAAATAATTAPGSTPTTTPAAQPQGATSIQIARPLARPGLLSDHIALVEPDHRLSYYVASRWPAELPDVVEALALETLRNSGGWATVQDSSGAFASEYLLQIIIQRFEADYVGHPAAPVVHVVFDCTVGKRAGREMIASFTAEGSAAVDVNRLSEVVAAFEAASSQALRSIAQQSTQAVRSAQAVKP